ncbi:MAG: mannose-6-phosphate isomerase, class I [Desulfobacterales bacterium]|nr:mannose-6-phosphate isomerase, class I [Desulfobacterales bacterium]
MKHLYVMQNSILDYEWGSYTFIPELLGLDSPSLRPQAELWMGAHPKAPSMICIDGTWTPLNSVLKSKSEFFLGKNAVQTYGLEIPYLVKVLSARKALSIQAHPNKQFAEQGFLKENLAQIPFNDPKRNYRDPNHKPECICALTDFYALCGFRKIETINNLISELHIAEFVPILELLHHQNRALGLCHFFRAINQISGSNRKQLISKAIKSAKSLVHKDPCYSWILRLYEDYPDDMGILAPLYLNWIHLQPTQALFLESGVVHAYLEGSGIEIMANSDNVLRCGITEKNKDIDELSRIVDFQEKEIDLFNVPLHNKNEYTYPVKAQEFVLSVINLDGNITVERPMQRSLDIILCTEGNASISLVDIDESLDVHQGISILIPFAVNSYSIYGKATLYKVSVGSM